MEIFKYLSIMDLCAVRNTSVRLQTIANYFFAREPMTAEFHTVLPAQIYRKKSHFYISINESLKFVQNFGNLISKLRINFKTGLFRRISFDVLILEVNRHCDSLVYLQISEFEITAKTFEKCRRLFSQLETIVFDRVRIKTTLAKCLEYATSLRALVLRSVAVDFSSFEHFAKKNRELETLKLIECRDMNEQIFAIISNNLPNLITFCYVRFEDALKNSDYIIHDDKWHVTLASIKINLLFLLALPKLQELILQIDYRVNINEFLRQLSMSDQNIKSLHLSKVLLNDETIRCIWNLKTLIALSLTRVDCELTNGMWATFTAELPNLKEVNFLNVPFYAALECAERAAELNTLSYDDLWDFLHDKDVERLVEICLKKGNFQPLKLYLDLEKHKKHKHLFQLEKEGGGTCKVVNVMSLSKDIFDIEYEYK